MTYLDFSINILVLISDYWVDRRTNQPNKINNDIRKTRTNYANSRHEIKNKSLDTYTKENKNTDKI